MGLYTYLNRVRPINKWTATGCHCHIILLLGILFNGVIITFQNRCNRRRLRSVFDIEKNRNVCSNQNDQYIKYNIIQRWNFTERKKKYEYLEIYIKKCACFFTFSLQFPYGAVLMLLWLGIFWCFRCFFFLPRNT